VVISSATEPLRRELRKRPAEKRLPEGPSQRRRREEEEAREREEESLSSGSGSASDPGYRLDPGELAAAREDPDDGDDDDDFTDEDE
jgi:hypothetical protein